MADMEKSMMGKGTYPQDPKALSQAPAAEKVNLKLVVENHDGVFFPVVGGGPRVCVDGTLGT